MASVPCGQHAEAVVGGAASMARECGLRPEAVVEPLFEAFSLERSGGDEQLFAAVPAMLIGLVGGHGLVAHGDATPPFWNHTIILTTRGTFINILGTCGGREHLLHPAVDFLKLLGVLAD